MGFILAILSHDKIAFNQNNILLILKEMKIEYRDGDDKPDIGVGSVKFDDNSISKDAAFVDPSNR